MLITPLNVRDPFPPRDLPAFSAFDALIDGTGVVERRVPALFPESRVLFSTAATFLCFALPFFLFFLPPLWV